MHGKEIRLIHGKEQVKPTINTESSPAQIEKQAQEMGKQHTGKQLTRLHYIQQDGGSKFMIYFYS